MMLGSNAFVEFCVRFSYYRCGGRTIQSYLNRKKPRRVLNKIGLGELRSALVDLGIQPGDSVMVHSALSRIRADAKEVISLLKELVGPRGNILMPTHPKLDFDNCYYVYDIEHSPSRVGMLTEVFRQQPEVIRGKHPFSTVAAWGRDSEELIGDERLDLAPLPHGKHSPYFRFAQQGGKVICIGVTARNNATIKHTAEEVLDSEFPIPDLFQPVNVITKKNGRTAFVGQVRTNNVRLSQVFVAKGKIEREWLENDILKRRLVSDVPVEIVDAARCVSYMKKEISKGNTSYPYLRLISRGRRHSSSML